MSTPTDHSRAHALAPWFLALAVISWVQVAFGALVRAKKAGLSCPDWPLCHGEVVPNLKLEGVVYEYGHRVFALVVSALFAYLLWATWRDSELKARIGKWLVGGVVLLLVQIVFGGLTVLIVHTGDGDPRPAAWTVSIHLILGNSFAALALIAAQELARTSRSRPSALPPAFKPLLAAWTASLFAQFVLGGAVASTITGLVCTEFPTCVGGIWFPTWVGPVGLQIFHRLNAYLLVMLAAALVWLCRHHAGLRSSTRALLALIVGQATVGAINVLLLLPAAVTTAHSLLAALLFSLTALLWHRALASRATAE